MKPVSKLFTTLSLVILATFALVPSALAFDGRSGGQVLIPQDQVINDDLYLGGTEVVVEGTINGDLMAAGETVVINGVVTGDLFVGGSNVTINGEVGDDVFVAAAAVTFGPAAKVVDDVFSVGASVETRSGSQIGGSLLIGSGQGLLEGNVAEDLFSGSNRLRLEGQVGGNASVWVDSSGRGYFPNNFYVDNVPMPSVPAGLTFGPKAKVIGTLEYTSNEAFSINSSIATDIIHKLPPVDQELSREIVWRTNTSSSMAFDLIRRMVALLFVGVLIAWLAPRWITRGAEIVEKRPLPSLGIGFVGIVAAPLAFLTALGSILLLAVIFGLLSLGSLTGLTLLTGFPLLGLAFVAFLFIVSYLCQAILAYLTGRWVLSKVQPELNEKIYWPLMIGLLILAVAFAIPIAGGFLQFFAVLAGLGAIISLMLQRPSPAEMAPVVSNETV